ncbi:amidohydrolase [Cryptosporangium minutisporangium]|uniref:amidohydrolase n=1 Tax=Cryptosporangium minutisporangium TaxID=113569 RepID=UPI0035E541BD
MTAAGPVAPAGARSVLTEATALYLDLHAHPELSGAERRTAGRLAGWLARDGLRVTGDVGGHGVVGILDNGPGPVVMLRAELDALPVAEQTGLPYASAVTATGADGLPVPVMHACGHDLHVAALAGAARRLVAGRDHWQGTLLVVGQPAEETLEGARDMLEDGLFERFGRPDVVLAQHTAPLPAGMLAHGIGVMTAGSTTIEVVIHGRGSHAATPHLGIDPVVAAAATVLRLQTIVAREFAAAEQVVLTVGSLHAGHRSNVLPDSASLSITVRALSEATLTRLRAAVERVVRAECAASGCVEPPEVRIATASPVNVPDPEATAVTRAAHEGLVGSERLAVWPPSMATEDFPHYASAGAATVYWMLGSAGRRQVTEAPGHSMAERLAALPANHSPRFAPDVRQTLPTGVAAMVTAALAHLARP